MGNGSHDLAQDLARRLRAARIISGKSVPELARELGEGWSTDKVYRVEGGRQTPDALELTAIAEATGQPIDFFLGGTTTSQPQGDGVLTHSDAPSQEKATS